MDGTISRDGCEAGGSARRGCGHQADGAEIEHLLEAVDSSLVGPEPNAKHSGAFYIWLRDFRCMDDGD